MGVLDRFTSFIYSLFNNGRPGTWLSHGDSAYKCSACSGALDSAAKKLGKSKVAAFVALTAERSKAFKLMEAFRAFLFCLSLSVYGTFFAVFGFVSVFMYYIAILLKGSNPHGVSALVTSVIIIICSIPMLVSSRSAAAHISESKSMHKLSVSFFAIPSEKLKTAKRYGGAEILLLAALLAAVLGALTYFVHPGYIPITVGILILFLVVTANPETGVIITLAAAPFLQFVGDVAEVVLAILVLITCISYLSKCLKHRRVFSMTSEGIIVALFCAFIFVTSLFNPMGGRAVINALYTILIIAGGYYLTYNLMIGENKLHACMKVLAISFIVMGIIGIWNVIYDGIVDGVMYSIKDYVQPIFDDQSIGFYDSAEVFGVLAVLVFPMLFSYLPSRKTVSGVVGILILCALSGMAVFIYGTFETVLAIIIEFCLFWLIFSNKTLSVVAVALLPISIFVLMFPYLASAYGWSNPISYIEGYFPLGFKEAPMHVEAVKNGIAMILDGNLTGIGVGNEIFVTTFAPYAGAVASDVSNPASFILQIICWSGVGGLLTFSIFILSLLKNGYGYLLTSRDRSIKRQVIALVCGLAVALIYGTVNCLWSDMRMLYLFWACAGMMSGYIREGRNRESSIEAEMCDSEDLKEIELRFYK